jgi:hypothetical protein
LVRPRPKREPYLVTETLPGEQAQVDWAYVESRRNKNQLDPDRPPAKTSRSRRQPRVAVDRQITTGNVRR